MSFIILIFKFLNNNLIGKYEGDISRLEVMQAKKTQKASYLVWSNPRCTEGGYELISGQTSTDSSELQPSLPIWCFIMNINLEQKISPIINWADIFKSR